MLLKTCFAAMVVFIAALIFVQSGVYNVAADEPHLGVVARVLEAVRINSIEARADSVAVPDDLDSEERVRRGAQSYAAMCQECHLAPGIEPTPLHQGLNPVAPELDHAVIHGTRYMFWTIKHGIKMTGMPAWGATHADAELWDITAFLLTLPSLSAAEYSTLSEGAEEHDHGAHGTDSTHGGHGASSQSEPVRAGTQPDKEPQPPRGHEGHDHSH